MTLLRHLAGVLLVASALVVVPALPTGTAAGDHHELKRRRES